jgi:hypothetical protein
MKSFPTILGAGAAALFLISTSGAAIAAPCGTGLDTSNVTLTILPTIYSASSCAGPYAAPSGLANEVSNANALFSPGPEPDFVYLDKTDEASNSALGITFTVTATLTDPGTWSVSWFEAPGLPDLPEFIDFLVLLKGATSEAAYLLENVLLTTSPSTGSGTFDIVFTNNGGREPALSHLTLLGRFDGDPTGGGPGGGPGGSIPEPGTLSLLSAGLMGVAMLRRRRRA